MGWQDIVSVVGMYILLQIFVCGAHMCAAFMDSALYAVNKYNENRKTKKIGMKWLFWRCRKDENKEIFTIVFIHEIISACLFLVVTIMLVFTLMLTKEIIMHISFIPIVVYFLYCSIRQSHITRKNRNQHK